jgi:hypothetical protein
VYRFLILAGLGVIGASCSFAATTYAFLNSESGTQNIDNNEPISPYGGSIGASQSGTGNLPVLLFCDDFSDHVAWNSGWQVNLTNVGTAAAAPSNTNPWAATRFGAANANTAYPVGTQLYEEVAWLFTQDLKTGQSLANQDAIGEAVWLMTDPTGTPKDTASNTGSNLTYLQWISDAGLYYNKIAAQTPTQFLTVNYNNWYVATDPAAGGNTGGKGLQEMLAFYSASSPASTAGTMLTPAPEPASFILLGSGLVFAGVWGRRKRRSRA